MKDRDLSDREDLRREAADTLAIINQAWRSGRVMEMAPYLHEKMVITLPAFTRRVSGRENVIEGFREFSANARVLEYSESGQTVDVIGSTAVVSYRFQMCYERPGYRAHSEGRDLWLFERRPDRWVAVWRTMIDVKESREDLSGP
jgi:hypothetical protein